MANETKIPTLRGMKWHAANRGVGWEVHAVYEGHGFNCYCDVPNCAGSILTDGYRETMPQEWAEELAGILNTPEPQPNLSAAVQTLEKALERCTGVTMPRHPHLVYENAIREALALLARQREDTTP